MNIWSRLLGEGEPWGQDKLITDPPPLAAPGQVTKMLNYRGSDLVELDIELPVEIDLPDLTLTLPIYQARQLKAILLALGLKG